MTRAVVVMGVAGCGKTSVARATAAALGWRFLEGDAYHPAANIEKMANGIPLQDADRLPWLRSIAEDLAASPDSPAVVSCSALKVSYRELLRAAGDVRFVHLYADPPTLRARMSVRTGHFMQPAMLSSQLDDLEGLQPNETGVTLDADRKLNQIVNEVTALVHRWGFERPEASDCRDNA